MIALVLTVPANEAELAADALWALGVQAVEERSIDPALPEVPTEDRFVQLWTSLGDDHDVVRTAAEGFPSRWRWHTEEVDESVADTWRRHAVATWVSPDVVVVPDWLETRVPDGATVIRIDPGAAFGLGDHPTTVLTLRALHAVMWPDATVLDVGCGSGVLSVGAALFGASYVQAIDVASAAVEATVANADRNGVSGKVTTSTTPLAEIDGPFDIVLANILAHTLVELADHLRRVTSPSGVLVVSGVLDGSYQHVVDALAPMQVTDRFTREGWAAIVLRH